MDQGASVRTRLRPAALLPALLTGLTLYLAGVSGAAAHAVLLATEPPAQSVLETAPVEIVLRFNEPVTPLFVRVIGPDGEPLATPEAAHAIDTELRLPLPLGLPDGGYIVSYRVVSADSHPVSGSFAFSVGAEALPAAPSTTTAATREQWWEFAKILLRFASNAALLLAAGAALFQVVVLRPEDRLAGLVPAIRIGAAIAILSTALGVGVQGGLLAAAPGSALFDPGIWRLGASTSTGTAALVQIPALLVTALATAMRPALVGRIAAAGGVLVAATSLTQTGHSAGSGWPAQTALALHVIAVAYWLGALWPLHWIVRTRSQSEAATAVRRFSAVAVPAVALLVVAGVGVALTRIDDPATLIDSAYGRILLLKLALVLALVIVAVINRQHLTPALAAGSEASARKLRRNIRFELALATLILLTTAVLAHTAPRLASDEYEHGDHVHEAASGYSIATVTGGRTLLLEIAPAKPGANSLTLWLSDRDGQPLAPIEVTVALSLPVAGIEPLALVPERTATGRYEIPRVDLPVAGRWSLRVDVLVSDFEKATFRAEAQIE
ncbi:MAG: FixH family protein [Kiloniellales bacterium]